ncbi:rubrerythrin family protein [Deltaproteobacteria bacterium OttesenSCG-928-K17]|nr:rubrerythrin family protein [Deltaproteobacteria bacterium OttesenSCG-928-K17]
MTKLKGSQTEINIVTAFAGESQARNRYTYAAAAAKKEGYVKISQIFEETANQEKEHAKKLFKFLDNDQEVQITATFPAFGYPSDTKIHLANAAAGEHYEHTEMYPNFAKTAKAEGFQEVAVCMENIAIAEKYHEDRFNEYLDELKNGTYFKSEAPIVWRCLNCGYIHEGKEPPKLCPACAHPIDHFEALFNVVKPA